ncbi:MAG TPA: HAD family hydrolase, partial [Candidatus Polarisedimenticolaceae bacterium]|nr:HAD family hydrolase [Candidatus Polarisedimenticolaceae bacterium]
LIAELVGPDRIVEGVRLFRERYAEVYTDGTRVLTGVRATLADLTARGYRLSVASNKPARFGSEIARRLALSDYLVSVHGPDTVGVTKPHPAMLERCLADMGSTATHGLYVGDMVLDVESGARAGLPVVLVSSGSSSHADLQATGCLTIGSLEELRAILP